MTLPALAGKRMRRAYQLSIYIISAAEARAQQQTSRTPLLLSIDGTDRRTDGRTPDHYIDFAPHAGNVGGFW